MTTSIKTQGGVASPYAPYKSWKNLIDKLRGKRPLPSELDSTIWGALGFSGGMVSVLKPTMVSLGLLNKGMEPQPLLEELLEATDSNDGSQIQVYSKLLDNGFPNHAQRLDTERMTSGQLTSYLNDLGATGETGVKCRSFFLGLAKDAGLSISKHITARTRSQSGSPPRKRRERGSTNGRDKGGGNGAGSTPPMDQTADAPARASLMLWGLFKRLPAPRSVFTGDERESWIEGAKAIFNMEYELGNDNEKAQ